MSTGLVELLVCDPMPQTSNTFTSKTTPAGIDKMSTIQSFTDPLFRSYATKSNGNTPDAW
jgi:hypothetical protein